MQFWLGELIAPKGKTVPTMTSQPATNAQAASQSLPANHEKAPIISIPIDNNKATTE